MKEQSESDLHSSESLWMRRENFDWHRPLATDVKADVCVIGSGISGLTCAYTLLQNGLSVVVLEDRTVGYGETSRTTGHLCTALDDRWVNLKRFFGLEGARLAIESHAAAIKHIASIIRREGIHCHFRAVDGYLFAPPEQQHILEEEYRCLEEMGYPDFDWAQKAPISSFNTGRSLRFHNQAEFYPLAYLKGLLKAIQAKGGEVFTQTRAIEVEDGTPCRVHTANGPTVTAKQVIVATNSPICDRVVMHTKQAAYRTYVLGCKIPKGVVAKALYWDTLDPYHYIRVAEEDSTPQHDLVLIGGEDHRTGQDSPNEAFQRLEDWIRGHFPDYQEVMRWSGQVVEPVDSLAFIGHNPLSSHVYIVTGDSGNGLTHGTIAGMLIPDLILGRDNPWEEIYRPSRKTLAAAADFVTENANTAAQYVDWITSGSEERDLKPGKGVVIRTGMTKEAVCCDDDGTIHRVSAVCPHLGGIVRWNNAEKTWDCPCHGSRFGADGRVISGPAKEPLQQIKSYSDR